MADESLDVIKPTLKNICSELDYLDFKKSSDIPLEEKRENYYKCLDYCLELISKLIEKTLSKLDKNSFITFLCKD
jgi:hypothetical protein